jgi:hypothetical protein
VARIACGWGGAGRGNRLFFVTPGCSLIASHGGMLVLDLVGGVRPIRVLSLRKPVVALEWTSPG